MNLEPMLREFFERGGEAAAARDAGSLHAFRIAAKRLRYTLEILEPQGAALLLAKLRGIQRRLGAMNDALVAARLLEHCPYRSARARALPAKLGAEAQSYMAAFERSWRREFSERVQSRWLAWARAGN